MDENRLRALVDSRKTIREIAEHEGCSYSNVRYWLRKYELKTARGPHGKIKDESKARKCKCGETDPSKFYGSKRRVCGSCHNLFTISKGREKREFIINQLGGRCVQCGFRKYKSALDVHHLDPREKDPSSSSMRGWSRERISKELKKCVLMCKNCHAATHSGELNIEV